MKLALIALLLAAPLTAQEPRNISLVPAEQTNNIVIQFDSLRAILEDFMASQPAPMSDSTRQANFDRNMETLREILADDEDASPGATTTEKIGLVLIPVLAWIAWEIRGLKNNSAGVPGEPGKDGKDGSTGPAGPTGPPGEDASHDDHEDSESGESG